jgi:glycosyltransferase involved in cell wall biosynthesis
MRIAVFTETFLPKIDGIVIVLCHFLDYLANEGHEALVFAPEGGPSRYANARVIGLPGVKFFLYPELKLAPPLVGTRRPLNEFEPDLIYLVNPASLGLGGIWEARRLDVPLVASYHTDLPGFAARMGMAYTQRSLWAFFRQVYNQADLVFAPSNFTREQIEAHGFERVKVWNHGVDSLLYHPARRSAMWRMRLTEGKTHQKLLLFVGRLAAEKRVDWLLPVLEANPGIRLAIIGGGPAEAALKKKFQGTPTVFTGYLQGEDLAQAYASADLFVFPGANETFGNVVIEAMSSGLPIVAPDSGGLLDFMEDGVNGLLFESENQRSLVDSVNTLLANPDVSRRMGRAGRAKAETMSWEHVNDNAIQDFIALIHSHDLRKRRRMRFLHPALVSRNR